MILFAFTDSTALQIIMWGGGLFITVSLTILVHIGNAGAKIKEEIKEFHRIYGERIAHVETQTQNTAKDVSEIRLDLKALMMRKNEK